MFGWIKSAFAKRRHSPPPPPLFAKGDAMWNGVPVRTMQALNAPESSVNAFRSGMIARRRLLIAQIDEQIAKAKRNKKAWKGMAEEKTRILHEIMEIERKMGGERV